MKFKRPLAVLFIGGVLTSYTPRAEADALLDYLTYETFTNTANAGMNAYRELHAERARWANEKSRLQYQIKECGNCSDRAEYEAELEYWTKTEQDFQNIAGGLADLVGMDPLVQNLLGIETGAAISFNTTGSADPWFDFIKSDPPDWYAGSPQICQKNYGALMACAQVTQNPQHKDCTDVMKVTEWCEAGEYSEAEDYIHIMALRKSGMQIPEIRDIGWRVEVDFGTVPRGADLIVPSGEDLYGYLSNAQFRKTVQFIFRRLTSGILEHAEYSKFNASTDFFPGFSRTCGSATHMYKDPEACDFLHKLSHPIKDGERLPTTAFVLSCGYSDEPTVEFWLHEKPLFASDPRTKRVSQKMADAPAADFCPVKGSVARKMWLGQWAADRIERADYTQPSGSINVLAGAEGEVRLVSAAESLARIEAIVDTLREKSVTLQVPGKETGSDGEKR